MLSTCMSPPCTFQYTTSPELLGINATSVRAGDTVTVFATGLDATTCRNNLLVFQGMDETCEAFDCEQEHFSCRIPDITAGRHRVFMMVRGEGRALGDAIVTVLLSVTSVEPGMVGFGGGSVVTVQGSGFSPHVHDNSVSVCGVPCSVAQATDSALTCTTSRTTDRAAVPERYALEVKVARGEDDAYEYTASTGRTIVTDDVVLGFNMARIGSSHQSVQTAYMRFLLDVPNGANITKARLHVRAESASCSANSRLRISMQAADQAHGIEAWRSGSLSARSWIQAGVVWRIESRWRWPEEDQESADIAILLNQIVKRPGWRAGNAVLLSVVQESETNAAMMPCRFMSFEAGARFAPMLRVRFAPPDAPTPTAGGLNIPCNVAISTQAFEPKMACGAGHPIRGRAYASSEQVPRSTNVAKDAYPKLDRTLSFEKAVDLCARHSARLCMMDEIFEMRSVTRLPCQALSNNMNFGAWIMHVNLVCSAI